MKNILKIATILMLILSASTAFALDVVPGLKGFGTDTRAAYGAANDPVIFVVTNLGTTNGTPGDSTRNGVAVKTGSFREALNYTPPADTGVVIIFEVSGTINATSAPYEYRTTHQYLTIAGQTAPSPGITLRNIHLYVLNPDVLVQHLRIRVGDTANGEDGDTRRCITAGSYAGTGWKVPVNNVVIDHCSTSWGVDTDITIWEEPGYAVSDITVSNCIVGEALRYSIHPKTIADGSEHSKGMGLQTSTETVAALYNLFISNSDRNPYVRWGSKAIINNLIYNPNYSYTSVTLTGGSVDLAVVGNVMTAGPSTSGWGLNGFIRLSNNPTYSTNWDASSIYLIDNKWNSTTQANSEDWDNVDNFYSDDMDPYKVTGETPATDAPLWPTGLTAMSSAVVKDYVIANVGARPADRDSVDSRLINDVINSTGALIDSPTDVGGWPELATNTRNVGTEMPATLNAHTIGNIPASPHSDSDGDGYTDLEEWLHSLALAYEGVPPGGPQDIGSNDYSGDANAKTRHSFEPSALFKSDSIGSNDLSDPTACNAVASLTQTDNITSSVIGKWDVNYRMGTSIAKVGGFNACELKLMASAVGAPGTAGHTLYVEVWTEGTFGRLGTKQHDFGSIACDDAWDATEITITADSPVQIDEDELFVFTLNTLDSTNHISLRYNNTEAEAELDAVYTWDAAGNNEGLAATYDFYIKIYEVETGAAPSEDITNNMEQLCSADFELTNSEYFTVADLTYFLKNGTTNRIGGFSFRITPESMPGAAAFYTIISKEDSFKIGIEEGDALQAQFYDGAAFQSVTHGTALTAGEEYTCFVGLNDTTDTISIDVIHNNAGIWERLGTRVDNAVVWSGKTCSINANTVYIGAYTGPADFYDGLMDELVEFGDIITAAELLAIANFTYSEPAPTIISLDEDHPNITADDTYTSGNILIPLNMSEATWYVSGYDTIAIPFTHSVLGVTEYAPYSGGGGTSIWTFSYIPTTGARTTDLEWGPRLKIGTTLTPFTGPDGNGEYYATYAYDPAVVYWDDGPLTEGTLTSLGATEWAYNADNDRLYVGADPSGVTVQASQARIVDIANNDMSDISLPSGASSLGTLKAIVMAYSKDWMQTDYATVTLLLAGTYFCPDDTYTYSADTVEAGFDTDNSGTSGHPITINGNGHTVTGNMAIDEDYWTLNRVKHVGEITISGSNIVANQGLLVADWLKVMTGTGNVLNNYIIAGTGVLDLDVATTLNNCVVKDCDLAAVTATVNNLAFAESEATIEGDGGTLTHTDCLFSVADFKFVSATDYRLLWNSPCVGAGIEPTLKTDVRGRYSRPPYNIGCYQSQRIFYPGMILSTWSP